MAESYAVRLEQAIYRRFFPNVNFFDKLLSLTRIPVIDTPILALIGKKTAPLAPYVGEFLSVCSLALSLLVVNVRFEQITPDTEKVFSEIVLTVFRCAWLRC